MKKKKVIVMGKGDLGIKISEWFLKSSKYKLILIVPVIPEPKWAPSISAWAKSNNVPLLRSGHYKDISNPGEADLILSVFYDKIIDKSFISKCQKILNIHNGPLPRYRGVSPINWALKNNEKEHGITIHEISPGIDSGPIVAQLKYTIYPEFDEVEDVYKRSLEYGFVLFKHTMQILEKIRPYAQNDRLATYYNLKQNNNLGDRKDFTREKSNKN